MTTTQNPSNAGIKSVKIHNHKFEFYVNDKGALCLKVSQTMTTGKHIGQEKVLERIRFLSEADRERYTRKKIDGLTARAKDKADKKKQLDEARANFVNPFTVGQVFYDSWGYDQTNIDFYQVVEIGKRSIKLRKIGENIVPGSQGNMCEHVTPAVDSFTGESFTRPVLFRINYEKKAIAYVNGFRGGISLYDAGDTGLYQSHYA
jgi:hypothetical protein